jgi:hypothetical protein
MSNTTLLRGNCSPPFYDASKFDLGGCKYIRVLQPKYVLTIAVVDGRFCAPVGPGVVCCLPCPMTDFLYPQGKLFLSYMC